MKKNINIPLQKQASMSIQKAFSVIAPVVVYYVVVSMVNTVFAIWFSHLVSLEAQKEFVQFLITYASQASMIVNAIAMTIGGIFLFPVFKSENPVFFVGAKYRKHIPKILILGLTFAIAFNYLFGLLQEVLQSNQYEQVAQEQFSLPLWVGIIIYGMISPIVEELVFRGLVYNRLKRYFSVGIAIIFSSIIFGGYHGNAIQMGYGFVFGILMAVLYEKYDAFIVPVLLHSVANTGIYFIMNVEKIRRITMTGISCVVCLLITTVSLVFMLKEKNKE